MADRQERRDFGWQGIRLRVPEAWELGRVDGDARSGYARLDDVEMVRAEVEWRAAPERGVRRPVSDLVDRYLEQLQKKADKAGMGFAVERRAKFLRDKRWLDGSEFETFTWEADYRAYNLARACADCGRVVLLRLLARPGESCEGLVNEVFPTLEDHPRAGQDGATFWSVYGLAFHAPSGFVLAEHELKSGHIKLTFEKDRGAHALRVHRLSMAHMLLRGTDLSDWYGSFFRKDLRDLSCATTAVPVRGHEGLRVTGAPRSRWRLLLRPLPLVNPRPRRFVENAAWHCPQQNRLCVVEHLYRRRGEGGDLLDRLIDGYVCHPKQTETDARGDAGLAAGAQRTAGVGEDPGR